MCAAPREEPAVPQPASNPFFTAYPAEELAALWDLHKEVVGEREESEDATADEIGRVGRSIGGGLHDLVVKACEEPRPEKNPADKEDYEP
jgi:hypothetical protein